jgi:hypothetical protein
METSDLLLGYITLVPSITTEAEACPHSDATTKIAAHKNPPLALETETLNIINT